MELTGIDKEEFKSYGRGIQRKWGPLSLQAKPPNIEVSGGPKVVTFPGGSVDSDTTFVAGNLVAAHHWWTDIMEVFDAASGRRLHATHVVQSHIRSIAVSVQPAARYLLIGSADQTLTVYNPRTGKVLLTVFPTGDDWLAWTPEGYYAASPGGERFMRWHVDKGLDQLGTVYPAEQFREKFYRPDVIKRILETGNVEAALKAADVR